VSSNAYSLVREAILGRHQIHATYEGHHREMCPHVLGRTKDGHTQALFFQFAGTSGRGLAPGGDWRCMSIDRLEGVTIGPGEWRTAPNYPGPQTCVELVDVEVG
jgi:hypothetical protein